MSLFQELNPTRTSNLMKYFIILFASLQCSAALGQYDFHTWTNGHQYAVKPIEGDHNWNNARTQALSFGGDLVSLASAEENEFVFSLVDNQDFWVSQSDTWSFGPWIGLIQLEGSVEPDQGWEWVTGEPATYFNWNPLSGEPNDGGGGEDKAHYHARWQETAATWNDLAATDVTQPSHYVVEVVPEPAATFYLGLALLGLCKRAARLRT